MSNPTTLTFNVPIKEFHKNYECVDNTGDLWVHMTTGKLVQVTWESDEYYVLRLR